jgi:hypothetical protein
VPVVLPVNIFRVGGSLAGPVVKVTTNTHLYESVELFLVTSAPNGLGRLFISVEAPSVSEWSDYMWFHPGEGSPLAPREGRVPPPRLVLVKDALGFLQDAHHHFYVDDYLKRNSPDELFEIGDIEGLKGETVIFKSWHLQEGLTFSEETLKMIQSVEINFI